MIQALPEVIDKMKLPGFKRLLGSDFEKQFQDLINQLSLSYNNPIDVLYQALNNNITLRDNIKSTVQDLTVTVDANGLPTSGSQFKLTFSGTVDGVTVLSAQNQDNSTTYPTNGVFISGAQNSNVYTINHITGLQAGASYKLRVVAWIQ